MFYIRLGLLVIQLSVLTAIAIYVTFPYVFRG